MRLKERCQGCAKCPIGVFGLSFGGKQGISCVTAIEGFLLKYRQQTVNLVILSNNDTEIGQRKRSSNSVASNVRAAEYQLDALALVAQLRRNCAV